MKQLERCLQQVKQMIMENETKAFFLFMHTFMHTSKRKSLTMQVVLCSNYDDASKLQQNANNKLFVWKKYEDKRLKIQREENFRGLF